MSAVKRRFALYTRESTEKQLEGRAYDSHASQEDFLRVWVKDQAGEVVTVYRDTQSGTSLDKRDGLIQLLADAQDKKFDVAVAYDIDRWHRSMEVYVLLRKMQKDTGVQFISATQRFDDTPEGRCMETQFSAFAEYLSALIGKKVKIKRRKMAELGMFRGGRVPFGYRSVDKKLVPHEVEADVVRKIFCLYLTHRSVAALQHAFRAEGIKDRSGRDWSNTSLDTILRNRLYIGKVREGEKLYDGQHQPLVDQGTFEAAQAVLPTKRRQHKEMDRVYPLLEVLQCGCGAAMTCAYTKKPNGRKVPYYRCVTSLKRGWRACEIRTVNADQMEACVGDIIEELAAQPDLVAKSVVASNNSGDEKLRPLRERETALNARLKDIKAEIAQIVAVLKVQGAAVFESVKDELAACEKNKAMVELELSRLQQEIGQVAASKVDAERVQAALRDLRAVYDIATPEEKGQLLRLIFKRIQFNGPGKNLVVELFDRNGLVFERSRTGDKTGSKSSTFWLPLVDDFRQAVMEMAA